ncbi:MAG: SRPBCC family protein [Carbonactinosporaceae bacterium]
MELEHEFVVPVPVADAWKVLLDVERVAPCMPGATLDSSEGDEFTGRVRVKVGPITVTYRGSARFSEQDEAARRVVIDANGREARGSGTARATVRAQLHDEGSSTRVTVTTDLTVTGRPAQFGRGVMAEVGNKILGRFAASLAEQLQQEPTEPATEVSTPKRAPEEPPGEAKPQERVAPASYPPVRHEPERAHRSRIPAPPPGRAPAQPINLFATGGTPVLKRLAPAVAGLAVLSLLWRLLRRNKR